MTTIEGIDAAWGRPTPSQLIAAGKHFIIGYVSHDVAKNLSKSECEAYLAAGIDVGLVWETTADRALSGTSGGQADGVEARWQANALGFPVARPIYFAVDFQATSAQLAGPVRDYGIAFRQKTGLSGVYGGLATVRYFADHDLADYLWQTYAWSGGVWDTRAHIQQYHNGVQIAGHDTDLDRAMTADYGQWTGVDMSVQFTADFLEAVKDPAVAAQLQALPWQYNKGGVPDPPGITDASTLNVLGATYTNTDSVEAKLTAQQAQLDAQGAKIDQMLTLLQGLTGEAIPVTGTVHLQATTPPVTG